MHTSTTVTFKTSRRAIVEALIMEQAPWSGGTGVVTKLDFVKAVASTLYGDPENEIDCGMDGDCYSSGLFIYPFDVSLPYQVDITHGELGELIIQDVEVREIINFSLDTERSTRYPIQSLVSYEWYSDTYDVNGAITSDPVISIENNTISTSKKVYGAVVISYMTLRHARTLLVPPREESVENVFDSYAWARWNGGVKMLKLKPPTGAEDAYFNQQNCVWGGRFGTIIPPDEPGDPYISGSGEDINIEYCTQKIIEYQ